MKRRIAVEIGAKELRAVWIESGALRWHARAALPDASVLPEALSALLSTRPRVLARARAIVALSPRWVQVRQLQGLPPVGSPRVAAQLLRENEQAFFLWTGRPGTIVVHVVVGRDSWGAAFDTEFLDAITRAVQPTRLRVVEICPSVAAIGAAFPGQSVAWRDAEHCFQIRGDQDGLLELDRVLDCPNCDPLPIAGALHSMGTDAAHFVAAYAAATLRRRLPLAWRPRADPARVRRRFRLINAAACIAILGAGAAAILAPAIRAAASTREAERELQRLHGVQQQLVSVQSELRRVSDALDRIATLAVDRGKITRILGALSQATPESTAILDLPLDSTQGAFTAIAPNVADLLPALADAAEIAAPQIVGSVTRETIAGVRLERAAFRFRRPHSTTGRMR